MTVALSDNSQEPVTQGTVPLHADLLPAKSKSWGCQSCRLYQYAGCFTKADREAYLATLDPDRRDKKNVSYQMEGQGSAKDGIMVILDMPTKADDGEGSVTHTAGAYLIRKYAKAAGLDTKEWYFTYAVKCHDPEDRTNMAAAVYCSGFLSDEIRRIQPKTILTFGIIALQLVIGRKDAMVSQFSAIPQNVKVAGHECTCFPMQSPSYIQRNDYLVKKYMGEFDKLASFLTGKSAVAVDLSQYGIVTDVDEAIAVCHLMIAATEKGKVIDADLETSGLNPYKVGARISILSLSCNVKKGYAIAYNHDDAPWTDEDRARFIQEGLRPLFRHPDVKLRWHNGKFDVKWCVRHFGFWPRDQWSDTMLVHYAVDENEEHGLKPLALRYTDMGDYDAPLVDYLRKQNLPDSPRFDLVPLAMVGMYAAQDPVAERKLAVELQKEVVRQDKFVDILANRILPAIGATITRLEHAGCAIDIDYGTNFAKPYLVKAAEDSYNKILSEPTVRQFIRDRESAARAVVLAAREAKSAEKVKAGKKPYPYKPLLPPDVKQYATEFSLNSPAQLQELIYGQKYYANEALSFSDSGAPSTDKEALTALIAKGSPIAKALMEYRLDEKLVSSYIEPILGYCAEQGDAILHPNFKIAGTATGRASTNSPNLQSIPNKSGSVVKRLIVSRHGADGCIVQADFSQLELRILACAARDKKMLDAYRSGKDLHLLTACMIFGMTEEEFGALDEKDRKLKRTIAKRINFGTCLAEGTPILTRQRGWVPVESVDVSDELWDGAQWVAHSGVICNGLKKVIDVGCLRCTVDHAILTDEGWVSAWDYANTNKRASGTYLDDGRFVLSTTARKADSFDSWLSVRAGTNARSTIRRSTTFKQVKRHSARLAEWRRHMSRAVKRKAIVSISRTRSCEKAGLRAIDSFYDAARIRNAVRTQTTAVAVLRFTRNCATLTASLRSSRRCRIGIHPTVNSTVSTTTGITRRAISASFRSGRICVTRGITSTLRTRARDCASRISGTNTARNTESAQPCRRKYVWASQLTRSLQIKQAVADPTVRVYDILNCGPRNRFQAGPLIVHNCYGIGAPGIQSSLASDGVQVTEDQAKEYLESFYEKYPAVTSWIEKVEGATTDNAFSRSLFGRRRRLEQVRSNVSDVVARALRQGVNFVIQSTGADMTWTSMLALDREICARSGMDSRMYLPTLPRIDVPVDKRWRDVKLVLQVHDSIVADCPVSMAAEVVDLFNRTLPNVIEIAGDIWGPDIYEYLQPMRRLPAACDVEVGLNYRDAYKVKTGADVEKAMFVSAAKKRAFDPAPTYKWGESDDAAAMAAFKATKGIK